MRRETDSFWRRLFYRYRLSIEDEGKDEEQLGIYVSKGSFIIAFALFVTVLVSGGFFLGKAVTNYKTDRNDDRMSVMESRVDSLYRIIQYQNVYIENFRRALSSEFPYDTIPLTKAANGRPTDELKSASDDELDFRRSYEKEYKQRTGKSLKTKSKN